MCNGHCQNYKNWLYSCDLDRWPVRSLSCFRSDLWNIDYTSATHYISQILGNNLFCLLKRASTIPIIMINIDSYLGTIIYIKATSESCPLLLVSLYRAYTLIHQDHILLHDVNQYPEYLRCEVSTFYCNIKPFTVSH